MPYKSMAQMRFAHTPTAAKKGFPTEEFDNASRGKMGGKPEHVAPPKKKSRKKRPTKYPMPMGVGAPGKGGY